MTLFIAFNVSSLTHFPSASGSDVSLLELHLRANRKSISEKVIKNSHKKTYLTFKCFSKVNLPTSSGIVTK